MRNLLFTIAFDGANYHGWQVQTNGISVQETVQDALEKVCGKRENIIGCSRTDAVFTQICIVLICARSLLSLVIVSLAL